MQIVGLTRYPAAAPERVAPVSTSRGSGDIGGSVSERAFQRKVRAYVVFPAGAHRPGKFGGAINVGSIGIKVVRAKTNKGEWPGLGLFGGEVPHDISHVRVLVQGEQVQAIASTKRFGDGVGLAVVPVELKTEHIVGQVTNRDAVVHAVFNFQAIEQCGLKIVESAI